MDKKLQKERLKQIWDELTVEVKWVIINLQSQHKNNDTRFDMYWLSLPFPDQKKYIIKHEFIISKTIENAIFRAKELPDSTDHKAERIERLNILLSFVVDISSEIKAEVRSNE